MYAILTITLKFIKGSLIYKEKSEVHQKERRKALCYEILNFEFVYRLGCQFIDSIKLCWLKKIQQEILIDTLTKKDLNLIRKILT